MSLRGKIVQLGSNSYGFEYITADYNQPIQTRQIWKLETFRCHGMSWCQESDAIGKDATLNVDGCTNRSTVSCYLGNGNYFTGTMPSKDLAILHERKPIARPKVRATTELRWQYGAWQKYSKRDGWVQA